MKDLFNGLDLQKAAEEQQRRELVQRQINVTMAILYAGLSAYARAAGAENAEDALLIVGAATANHEVEVNLETLKVVLSEIDAIIEKDKNRVDTDPEL